MFSHQAAPRQTLPQSAGRFATTNGVFKCSACLLLGSSKELHLLLQWPSWNNSTAARHSSVLENNCLHLQQSENHKEASGKLSVRLWSRKQAVSFQSSMLSVQCIKYYCTYTSPSISNRQVVSILPYFENWQLLTILTTIKPSVCVWKCIIMHSSHI